MDEEPFVVHAGFYRNVRATRFKIAPTIRASADSSCSIADCAACRAVISAPTTKITPSAERILLNARWDGNVRELKNAVERACLLAEGSMISERELGVALQTDAPILVRPPVPAGPAEHFMTPPLHLDTLEREHIVEVLRQARGNRMAAAKLLGISRRALYRRLERHHIVEEAPRRQALRRS